MRVLSELFARNRAWAAEMTRQDPAFFERLGRQQAPKYLWIGCSDSRVPANQIVGLLPGEMFVHRNIANVVVHADLNCLSAIQFAVDALRVEHIIVCGHYGCGGVLAALRDDRLGLVDNWLRHVQDVRWKHLAELETLATEAERHDRLCELNVLEQVVNVAQTTVVRDAWARGQALAVHGWIYGIRDGLLRDLGLCITGEAELPARGAAGGGAHGRRRGENVRRLDHLVLTVASIERTAEFYGRVLGMRVVRFGAGRVALHFGEQKINLHERGAEIEPHAAAPTPGSADLCFVVEATPADVLAHLERCGVDVVEGPAPRTGALGPITSVYFRDPDGNLIELSSYGDDSSAQAAP